MARTISDEELQLKRRARRRLIGAVVLVTAIAVVLPMVLDSEPKPVGQEVTIQIPAPDSGTFASKVVPLARAPEAKPVVKPPAESRLASKPPPAEENRAAEPAPAPEAKPAPKPSAREGQRKAAKAKPKPKAATAKPAAKPASEPFVVQVIALADAGRAKQMQEEIAAAGIKSYTEVVKTAKGDVTRVRAGPFATREAAEKAREQLKTLGMNGNIATR